MKTFRWLLLVLTAAALLTTSIVQAGSPADKKPASKSGADNKSGADKKTATTAKLVDINSASAEELDALPGIGTARSAAIIKGRPYSNKSQLVSKGILTQATYDKISDRIVARQK